MSYIIRGHKDLLFDPIGSVSACHKARTKLDIQLETTICSECDQPCDMYVPETKKEFEDPKIKSNGQSYYEYEEKGLRYAQKFNESMGGRDG